MKKTFLVLFVILSHFSFGQVANLELNGVPLRVSGYSGVDGSPYLFDDWAKADVATTNGGVKENVSFKFNIHENELEVISETGNKILLDKKYLAYFTVERPVDLLSRGEGLLTKLLFEKGYDVINGVGENDFVNVLVEGDNYTLVRKFYTDLVTPPKNSYAPSPGKMFVFDNILNNLSGSDKAIGKEIIKEGKLDLSREDHLVIFFQRLEESKG
jgi:hypothetical protein